MYPRPLPCSRSPRSTRPCHTTISSGSFAESRFPSAPGQPDLYLLWIRQTKQAMIEKRIHYLHPRVQHAETKVYGLEP